MENQNNSERRNFTRIPFTSVITLYDAVNYWECEMVDISLKGVLLKMPEKWGGSIGKKYSLDLALRVSEQDDIENRIHMYVIELVHIKNDQAGFRWENIDIDSFIHLRRLLEYNREDPDGIDREIFQLANED